MKYFFQQFSYAVIAWVFVVLLDTIRTMFSLPVNASGQGMMGVHIDVIELNDELTTNFSATPSMIVGFLIVVLLWTLCALGVYAYKTQKNNDQ
ncbi:MAG: hypothetical protein J6M18_04385 [Actinomycetaceae bacterium]|nr:hypothetical protein [Actinomycetaceae bacterium]